MGLEPWIKDLVYRSDPDNPLIALGYIPLSARLWLSDVITALLTDPDTAFDIRDDLLDDSDLTDLIIRDLIVATEEMNLPVPNPTNPVSVTFGETFDFVIMEY